MTFDDVDSWWVTCSQFVGADFKSGISFVDLSNDPEAQDSCNARIITDEMSNCTETAHDARDLV